MRVGSEAASVQSRRDSRRGASGRLASAGSGGDASRGPRSRPRRSGDGKINSDIAKRLKEA
eukprot:8069637-Pyramimonas_sp.AAC.1